MLERIEVTLFACGPAALPRPGFEPQPAGAAKLLISDPALYVLFNEIVHTSSETRHVMVSPVTGAHRLHHPAAGRVGCGAPRSAWMTEQTDALHDPRFH